MSIHHWISVEDKLPPEDTPVMVVGLVHGLPLYVTTAMLTYSGDGWMWAQLVSPYNSDLHDPSNYEYDDDYQYTHWLPLPEPPKGDNVETD